MDAKSHTTSLAEGGFARGFDRSGSRQGPLRRAMRRFIHFFSYNFVLKRNRVHVTRAAGFDLRVRPTVFHPKYFLSSEYFAEFIDTLDLTGQRVVDVGTGSGVLALACARAGAAEVFALDINPNAVLSARDNAKANGFADRVTALEMNLLAGLPAEPAFDVILSSPPKHEGEAKDIADRGWHAGPQYRDVADLFAQARQRLKPDGRLYLMVSSDSNIDLLSRLAVDAGFKSRLVIERSFYIESMLLYELRIA